MKQIHNQKPDFSITLRQESNPVWKIFNPLRKVNQTQVSDIIIDDKISILFLTLKFHIENPNYIKSKLDLYFKSSEYKLHHNRVLLLLIDTNDPNDQITNITFQCINLDIKILIGFNYEEISKYLRAFKQINQQEN